MKRKIFSILGGALLGLIGIFLTSNSAEALIDTCYGQDKHFCTAYYDQPFGQWILYCESMETNPECWVTTVC